MTTTPKPSNQPVMRLVTRPNEANSRGDIFGGWLMGQMDIAGAVCVTDQFTNDIATRAVNQMNFYLPIIVGMILHFDAQISHVGKTSLTVKVNVFGRTRTEDNQNWQFLADAEMIYVAIKSIGSPTRLIKR